MMAFQRDIKICLFAAVKVYWDPGLKSVPKNPSTAGAHGEIGWPPAFIV